MALSPTRNVIQGVVDQLRLQSLHHLGVPWLPSQIKQREGRIVRQGHQLDEVDIFAYATLGSRDPTMWQTNERKARFIAAAPRQTNSRSPAATSASCRRRGWRLTSRVSNGCAPPHQDDQFAVRCQIREEGQTTIASIGGFAVEFKGERMGRDGFCYATLLVRRGVSDEVELPVTVTPLGAVAPRTCARTVSREA